MPPAWKPWDIQRPRPRPWSAGLSSSRSCPTCRTRGATTPVCVTEEYPDSEDIPVQRRGCAQRSKRHPCQRPLTSPLTSRDFATHYRSAEPPALVPCRQSTGEVSTSDSTSSTGPKPRERAKSSPVFSAQARVPKAPGGHDPWIMTRLFHASTISSSPPSLEPPLAQALAKPRTRASSRYQTPSRPTPASRNGLPTYSFFTNKISRGGCTHIDRLSRRGGQIRALRDLATDYMTHEPGFRDASKQADLPKRVLQHVVALEHADGDPLMLHRSSLRNPLVQKQHDSSHGNLSVGHYRVDAIFRNS